MTGLVKYLRLVSKLVLLSLSFFLVGFSLLSGSEEYGGGLNGIIANSPNALPWLLLLGLNYLVYKWEKVGSIAIIFLGIFTVYFFNALQNPFVLFVISIPLIILGGFLLLTSFYNKQQKDNKHKGSE